MIHRHINGAGVGLRIPHAAAIPDIPVEIPWLIYRDQYRIKLETLPASIYLLLMAVKDGMPLQHLAEQRPECINHLPNLISQGRIYDFEPETSHA